MRPGTRLMDSHDVKSVLTQRQHTTGVCRGGGLNQYQTAAGDALPRVCEEHAIAHRLTKPTHSWTHGQVERMNRTLKEATVKTDYDQTHQPLTEDLHAFLLASNVAKRLTTLRGLTPDEYICPRWQKEPKRLTMNPYHHTLGPNI